MQNKKVLLFTYYWPPSAGPGVQRWLKFCKYLVELDFDVTVVTPANPTASNYDDSLKNDVPSKITVVTTKTLEPFEIYNTLKGTKGGEKPNGVGGIGMFDDVSFKQKIFNYIRANFFVPDARKGWNLYAYKKGVEVLNKQKFDIIITTGPPHSTHLTGLRLSKKFNIPWIADFRDPWINIFYNKYLPRSKRTLKKDTSLETQVLNSADLIQVVSPGLKREFENRAKKIKVVYNGFDEDDIPKSEKKRNKKFTISYVGNFKPNQNVEMLWKSVKRLDQEKSIKDRFLIKLTGNVDQTVIKSIEDHKIDHLIAYESYKPHKEAVKDMANSDALLFIIPDAKGNDLILTGKLFEYLACCIELVSIGPEKGNAAKIIHETGRGVMNNYTDEKGIYERLVSLFEAWLNGDSKQLSFDSVAQYSRKGMTKELVNNINTILNERN